MTDETANTPAEIELTIPLDDAHAEMVAQLREAGYDVEQIAQSGAAPAVDQALHEAFLASKYGE